jgi:glycosyltransferase involved in cell wall biosynthesis
MIVKDEEESIGRCLSSIYDLMDEIIIVDTGSVDQTKKIARQFTNKIYDYTWIDNFSSARNYSFGLASKQYTMWLDADDVIDKHNRKLLRQLKLNLDPSVNSVSMNYLVNPDKFEKPTFIIKRNRLVKTNCQFKWTGAVHEYLKVNGPIFHSDISIHHHKNRTDNSKRNLLIYEKQLEKGVVFTPRDLFYYANELCRHKDYQNAIKFYDLFLTHKEGWKEDKITSCGRMADCYRLLNDDEKEMEMIFKSFTYDDPRADNCCRLGSHFLKKNLLKEAVHWYKLATKLKWNKNCMGYYHVPSWTWLPHLQLATCYYKMGNFKKAFAHNKIALGYLSDDVNIYNNHKLIIEKLKKTDRF